VKDSADKPVLSEADRATMRRELERVLESMGRGGGSA
jgi:hypothetical protein